MKILVGVLIALIVFAAMVSPLMTSHQTANAQPQTTAKFIAEGPTPTPTPPPGSPGGCGSQGC